MKRIQTYISFLYDCLERQIAPSLLLLFLFLVSSTVLSAQTLTGLSSVNTGNAHPYAYQSPSGNSLPVWSANHTGISISVQSSDPKQAIITFGHSVPSGTYEIKVVDYDANMLDPYVATLNVVVTNVPPPPATPTATIVSNGNGCGSRSASYNGASPPTGVTWYWQDAAGNNLGSGITSPTQTSSGNIYLKAYRASDNQWSSERQSHYLNVIALPDQAGIQHDAWDGSTAVIYACKGETATLMPLFVNDPEIELRWYRNPVITPPVLEQQNTGSIQVGVGNTPIHYILKTINTQTGCESIGRPIRVEPLLPAYVSSQTIHLPANQNTGVLDPGVTGITSYKWYQTSDETTLLHDGPTFQVSPIMQRTNFYARPYKSVAGKTCEGSLITITVIPGPLVINGPTTYDLEYDTAIHPVYTSSYTAHAVADGVWTIDGTPSARSFSEPVEGRIGVTWRERGTYTITLTFLPINPHLDTILTATKMVVVTGPPPAPTANFSFTKTGCTEGLISYTNSPPMGIKWYWQTSELGTDTSQELTSFSVSQNSPGNYPYYLRAKEGDRWSTTSQAYQVNFSQPPGPPVVDNPAVLEVPTHFYVCVGESATITASDLTPHGQDISHYIKRWYDGNGVLLLDNTTGFTTPVLNGIAESHTYQVANYDPYTKCESDRITFKVSVLPRPQLSSQARFGALSGGNTPVVVSNAHPAFTYQWYTAGQNTVLHTGSSYTPTLPAFVGGVSEVSFEVATLFNGCQTGRTAVSVAVYQLPQIGLSSGSAPTFFEGEVKLQSQLPVSYDTYEWQKQMGSGWVAATSEMVSSGLGTSEVSIAQVGVYRLQVSKEGASGVSNEIEVKDRNPLHSQRDLNYVTTRQLLVKQKDYSQVATMKIGNISESTTYFDGLGRPLQTVSTQASPDRKDLVQPIAYDPLGRTLKQYLPYTGGQDGFYKTDALTAQSDFYKATGQNYATTDSAFAKQEVENSPLNRVEKQMAPGASWVGNNKGVTTKYFHNGQDEVRILEVNNDLSLIDGTTGVGNTVANELTLNGVSSGGSLHQARQKIVLSSGFVGQAKTTLLIQAGTDANRPVTSLGYYAVGTLSVVQVTDEDGKITQEFKNQKGQVVLKRALVGASQNLDTLTYQDTTYHKVAAVVDSVRSYSQSVKSTEVISDTSYTVTYDEIDEEGHMYTETVTKREVFRLTHVRNYHFKTDWHTHQILDTLEKIGTKLVDVIHYTNGEAELRIAHTLTGDPDTLATLATVEPAITKLDTLYIQGIVNDTIFTTRQKLIDRSNYAETYYVYDDFGNLSYVLPPEATRILKAANWEMSNPAVLDSLQQLWYKYYYDGRQRLIVKEVPGAGKVQMIYDPMDRLILSQDANQRASHQWSFTKYDALNRPVMTGLYHSTQSRAQLQASLNANFEQSVGYYKHETFEQSLTASHLYTQRTFPQPETAGDSLNIHSVTYYDDYRWQTDPTMAGFSYDATFAPLATEPLSSNTQGQVTATRTAVLNEYGERTRWLHTVSFYDVRNRVLQTQANNHQGGKDITATQYDFAGRVHQSVVKHQTPGNDGGTYYVYQWTDYDHTGRVLSTYQKIEKDQAFVYRTLADAKSIAEPVSKLAYNTRGELITKKLGQRSSPNGGVISPLQTLDFRYNIRGWMTHLNDAGLSTKAVDNDIFGFELKYDQGALQNYLNGNIGQMVWQSSLDGIQRQYDYSYDMLNRLAKAAYTSATQPSENGRYDVKNLKYDLNGNILTLTRHGLLDRKLDLQMSFGVMDELTYNYKGNQLLGVKDEENVATTGVAGDFRDGHTHTVASPDYHYDVNGNMIEDKNKEIVSIRYNHLNLPTLISFTNNRQLIYTYDAAGIKLCKVVIDSTGAEMSRTDYVGSFVYENDALQFIHTAEGRALAPGTVAGNGDFLYEYHYKDHLGNLRVAFRAGDTLNYQATLEDVTTDKQQGFEYDEAAIRTTDPTNGSNHVAKLIPSHPLGMLRNVEVSKGDQVKVKVKGYYNGSPSNNQAVNWGLVLGNLGSTTGNANSGEVSSQNSPFLLNLGLNITPNGSGSNPNASVPSGYLKSLFYKQDGTAMVSSLQIKHLQAGSGNWQDLELTYTAPERGYIQVFVANESDQEVFFDQMEVEHIPQLIVQENHYYPFGLELAGLNKRGKPEHRWKFQGQEEQKEFGLNWSSFKWRNADVALGRFFSVDPLAEDYVYNSTYAFSENRVINAIELEGLEAVDLATHQKANGVFGGLFTYGIDWLTSGTRKMSQGVKDYQWSQNQKNGEGYVDNVPANDRLKMDYVRENKAIGKMAEGVMEHYGAHHDMMGIVMGGIEGSVESALAQTFKNKAARYAAKEAAGTPTSVVTYYRVQGGESMGRVAIGEAGDVTIQEGTLNISKNTMDHARYFQGKDNRAGSKIYAFDVPKWLDDMVNEYAIPSSFYRTNPRNQGRLAPKIVDSSVMRKNDLRSTAIEFPKEWSKWIQEYHVKGSGRIID